MNDFLNIKYFHNTVAEYLTAAAIITAAILLIHIIKKIVITRIRKTIEAKGLSRYNFMVKSINRFLIPALYLGSIYIAFQSLSFGPEADKITETLYALFVMWFSVRFAITFLDYFMDKYFEKIRGKEDAHKLRPLIALLNFIIWIIGLLFLLDNLGFHVSAIITGLGISGIAVALAAQALLGDLFSYFVIFFDRPFEIDDFIVFDGNAGSIEKIGIKTTRVRSLSGEQLIVSNSKLTSTLVHNFKKMERRRVVFKLGVVYQTKYEQLKEIPGIVKEIVTANEQTQFDRAHFQGYGDFSINFEIVYYVLTSDYTIYMNIQEKINLAIYEEFEKRNIEFAYPTQTLFVSKEG